MHGSKRTIGFMVEVVVEPDDDGFHAYCPALKGLHTGGATVDEALENAKDAAIAYLQSLIKHGDPIPVGILIHEEIKETPQASPKGISRHTEAVAVPCAI